MCSQGWTTAVDSTNVFNLIYCNSSAADSGGAGGIVGQASSPVSCNGVVECFFVDELPYALVKREMGELKGLSCVGLEVLQFEAEW